MNNEVLHEQIAAYLQGSLSPAERREIETLLADNKEAQQELNDQQLVRELAEFAIASDLRKKFSTIDLNTAEPKVHQLPLRRWASIAAGVAVLLIAGGAYLVNQQYGSQQLMATYAQDITLISGQRNTSGPERHAQYTAGEIAFSKQKYAEAKAAFADVPANHPDYLDATFNLGTVSYLTEDYETASAAFQTYVDAQLATKTAQNAEWYLLLSQLGNNAPDEVIASSLQQILANPGHDYYQKAKDLDEKMKSFFYRLVN